MIKRRTIKVSERYGEGVKNHENTTRDNMLNAEEKFIEIYKGLSKEQKAKVNYEDGLQASRGQADKAKKMKFLSESDMMLAKTSDRPMTINQFIKVIKTNLHNNLVFVPNMTIGENVGGHSVFFMTNEGLEFICGVGKNAQDRIMPETEFQDVNDGTKTERKIKSRGYLPAIDTIIQWLVKHQQHVSKKDFLN